jgi:hypothetical protein
MNRSPDREREQPADEDESDGHESDEERIVYQVYSQLREWHSALRPRLHDLVDDLFAFYHEWPPDDEDPSVREELDAWHSRLENVDRLIDILEEHWAKGMLTRVQRPCALLSIFLFEPIVSR